MKLDCILLSWVSCKKLDEMLYLLNKWGFQYFNVLLVWVKLTKRGELQLNLGYYSRNNVELLVMAKRGSIGHFKGLKKDVSQFFYTLYDRPEAVEHSSKPEKAYELIDRVFKLEDMKCVEFFARIKKSRV